VRRCEDASPYGTDFETCEVLHRQTVATRFSPHRRTARLLYLVAVLKLFLFCLIVCVCVNVCDCMSLVVFVILFVCGWWGVGAVSFSNLQLLNVLSGRL
jgi:uncharacterized membrane protein